MSKGDYTKLGSCLKTMLLKERWEWIYTFISSSTVHNIQWFMESGGMSAHKGCYHWSLRLHFVKNHHSSIAEISTWANDYFWKSSSSTTIRSHLKCYCAYKKPYGNHVWKRCWHLWAPRLLGWTISQWKCELWSDESVFRSFLEEMDAVCSRPKTKRNIPDCY